MIYGGEENRQNCAVFQLYIIELRRLVNGEGANDSTDLGMRNDTLAKLLTILLSIAYQMFFNYLIFTLGC